MSSSAEDLTVHSVRLVGSAAPSAALSASPSGDGWLAAEEGVIVAIGRGEGWRERARGGRVVDGAGGLLVPGFTDLHGHGGGGHAHEDGPDAVLAAARTHREHGTTRRVVSFVSDDVDVLADRLSTVADLVGDHPQLLGSHLEGPFLSVERRGAHDPSRLVDPTPAAVRHLITAARGTLRQVTLDPQRPGAPEAIARFRAAGAVVAIGHTAVDHEQAAAAFSAGARLLTHAFNGMPGIGHRAPGPVVAAVDDPRVVCELVLDGEHVHPSVARLLFAAAPGRVALVSDAMAAAAAADGSYRLGGQAVTVSAGRAVLSGSGSLAGSTLTLDRALALGVAAGLSLAVVVEALTAVPAGVLGLSDRAGRLAPGTVADLVLLDEALRVREVFTSPLPLVPPAAAR